jgi:hypothetical protein
MTAGMAAEPGQLRRSKPGIAAGVAATILGWFAEIGQAARYFLRLRPSASAEDRSKSAVAEVGAELPATDDTARKPTASTPCATPLDVNVSPTGIVDQTVPDAREIERRRNLVRIFFNEFWSGAADKPAAFVRRLDEAEDYLNQRLTASGEPWRFDANTRIMLGLPPQSNSSVSANIDRQNSGQ